MRKIDDSHIIEYLIETGKISEWCSEISEVRTIEKTANGTYAIYCTFVSPRGAKMKSMITLPSSFANHEELLSIFEKLKIREENELEFCTICGQRLINNGCPKCGSSSGNENKKQKTWSQNNLRWFILARRLAGVIIVLVVIGFIAGNQMNAKEDYHFEKVRAIVTELKDLPKNQVEVTVKYEGKKYEV